MKIGIISMQEVINYGSFLQAYALMNLLEEENISFISINSQNRKKGFFNRKNWINEILSLYKNKTGYIQAKISRKKLKDAIIPFQRKYFRYGNGSYDLVIVGSDEVFNFAQEASWDNYIFLGKGLKYSIICTFAASCGFTTLDMIPNSKKRYIVERLNQFYAISVRDRGTYDLVQALCDKKVSYILDPVLLYKFENEIVENTYEYDSDYMIVYSYNYRFSDLVEIEEIRRFAKKYKLKIIAVQGIQNWTDEYIAVNPFQLFSLFDRAKFIVTDTFHGTIIASKLHKNFVSFIRNSNSNKLEDLMKRLFIEKHKYIKGNLEQLLLYTDDFLQYESILTVERKKAKAYINYIKLAIN